MSEVKLILLGTAQDGGYPQPGCYASCCHAAREAPSLARTPVALAIWDEQGLQLCELTMALDEQLNLAGMNDVRQLKGLWVTHAHLGHVAGMGLLGQEAMNGHQLPLHCSSSFAALVEQTPMWARLVEGGHIVPHTWVAGDTVPGGPSWSVEPILVPHRDELSDTHALLFKGPSQRLLFLPDHDSWEATLQAQGVATLRELFELLMVDLVLLDGTFWSSRELEGRNQKKVPHPPVSQTLELLGPRRPNDPRVVFVHLNHTNPLLDPTSPARQHLKELGWELGQPGQAFQL